MPAESPGAGGPRLAGALVLWSLAGVSAAILWSSRSDPIGAHDLLQAALHYGGQAALVSAGLGLVLTIAWPTTLPWLRHRFSGFRRRAGVDQQPLTEAMSRLEHFDNAPDHLTAARVYVALGQFPQAVPHLVKAVELEPDNTLALYQLGRSISLAGDASNGQRYLAEAVRRDPEIGFGEALHDLAAAAWRAGDDATVERAGAEHERRFGPEPRVDLLRAKAAKRAGRRDEARRLARRAARPDVAGQDPARATKAEPTDLRLARARAKVFGWRLGPADGREETQS